MLDRRRAGIERERKERKKQPIKPKTLNEKSQGTTNRIDTLDRQFVKLEKKEAKKKSKHKSLPVDILEKKGKKCVLNFCFFMRIVRILYKKKKI